jgi:hypothetical protein
MKIVMAWRKKLSMRMEPGNQYRIGAKMKCSMMTSNLAFEILAATYVLMFSDEAIIDATNSETSNAFDVRVKGLLQLARKSEVIEKPLCMFITGPAGAGKCK